MNKVLKNRKIFMLLLVLYDVIAIQLSGFLAIYIRFDFTLAAEGAIVFLDRVVRYALINTATTLILFALFGMYRNLWKYMGALELLFGFVACFLSSCFYLLGTKLTGSYVPRSFYCFYPVILGFFTMGMRCSHRMYLALNARLRYRAASAASRRIMVVGAGDAGTMIIKECLNGKYPGQTVVCAIDDDGGKRNKYVHGVKVVGNRHTIVDAVKKYDVTDIFISIPTLPPSELREIVEICQRTTCKIKVLPDISKLISGDGLMSKLKEVDIEDLLGRDSVRVNLEEIGAYVTGKVVLVTGGGGSIGSEICRQIAQRDPKLLIIFDIYENNAYDIQQELRGKYPDLNLKVLIGSVRNTNRIRQVFQEFRPEIVYHAAAHKHVPLMEESPNEAIKNNVFGTLKTARAAGDFGTRRFVLISTDKAVNPTNIMGASKRICEMIIQMLNNHYETEYVAVRFGNVLGSNGSVIPLFRKQIMKGGPITVTHPDIIRYFMTIPEATSLVLQAGAYAKGGEIFIFDMGEPVKIVDLARNMIRLSGLVPDEDIKIEFTGLRPGEKLYEELLMEEEGLQDTANHLIHVGKPIEFDEEKFMEQLEHLQKVVLEDGEDVRGIVKEMVPTYRPKSLSANR